MGENRFVDDETTLEYSVPIKVFDSSDKLQMLVELEPYSVFMSRGGTLNGTYISRESFPCT